jgi:hypothetical protein
MGGMAMIRQLAMCLAVALVGSVPGAAMAQHEKDGETVLRSEEIPPRDMTGVDLPQDAINGIRMNAKLVMDEFSQLRGKPMDMEKDTVSWVEGFIERQRAVDPEAAKGLVSTLGSYLGEAIIAKAGGEWRKDQEGHVGIRFANGSWCFPFSKVEKQIENGLEDSISSFYSVTLDLVATGKLHEASGDGK